MGNFVIAGSINYDLVLEIADFPRDHEKIRSHGAVMCPGGSAANTAYWLAKMGQRVQMVGAVGDDPFGRAALISLAAEGVSIDGVDVVTAEPTTVAVVCSTGANKRMITSRGPSFDSAIARFNLPTDDRCYVHVAAEPSATLTDFCSRAHGAGAVLSADFNGRDMSPISSTLFIAFLNVDEWRRLVGSQDVSWELGRGLVSSDGMVVVTMGRDGAMCLTAGRETHCAALPVVEVDRTGGGDGFNAAFLSAWSQRDDVGEALDAGLTLAAKIIGFKGARQ